MEEKVSQQFAATPQLRVRSVRGINEGSMKTALYVRHFPAFHTDEPGEDGSDEGPTPLELTLAALCGCEAVTFARVARGMKFSYTGLELEASGVIDIRGRSGVPGVRPHFQSVTLHAKVRTEDSLEKLQRIVGHVERRCPV
ncbi:MAG: OsmC family protein, partial [Dehalococcoidia bacterium]